MNEEHDEVESSAAPLLEHLIELRKRIMAALVAFSIAFFFCFLIKDYILLFILWPYKFAVKISGLDVGSLRLQSIAVWETLFAKITLAAFGGAILAFPYMAFQFYSFIAPGLYQNERKAFIPFLVVAPILFLIGGAFVYVVMAPIILWFSLSQQALPDSAVKVDFIVSISNYMSFMTSFILIFGLIFQLPLITSLLTKVGLVTSQMLASKRKWAVLAAVIIASIVTPSDLFTMFGVAVPIVLLYEVSIITSRWIEKRQVKKQDGSS